MNALLRRSACAAVLVLVLVGCDQPRGGPPLRQVPGGDAARGRVAFQKYGCGGCHVIPGVERATGRTAPSLEDFGERAFVAGVRGNEPDQLIEWIRHPQHVNPGTAMPDLGVSEADARDMAAHLYALRITGRRSHSP